MVLFVTHARAMADMMWAAILTVLRLLKLLLKVRKHSLLYSGGKYFSIADKFEKCCSQRPDQVIFVDASEDGKETTLNDLDELANQVAHWGMSVGLHVSSSDSVALMMENRSEFVSFWYGMAKIGVPVALINTGSVGLALTHSVIKALENNEGVKMLVTTRELYDGIHRDAEITLLEHGIKVLVWEDLFCAGGQSAIGSQAKTRPSGAVRSHVKESDALLYIYTSGTTGLPKAGKISHSRYFVASTPFTCMCALTSSDRIYTPLPLYHSSAVMMGVGSALWSGATMVIRRKFSVKKFTADCLAYKVTVVQYIGELCRYLKDAPELPEDDLLSIRMAFGNGLRPDVWLGFKKRYGVRSICEFYASTEGNLATFCIDRPGALGFVPRFANFVYPVRLVKADVDSGLPLRDPVTGFCIPCRVNEPGLVLGEINERRSDRRFDGYSDQEATNKKIMRNVFKKHDKYFNSGDMLTQDAIGYFYWCDRTGDTLRWKGENVSCSEVENALALVPCVKEVAVYPVEVPHHDGKGCMAAVVLHVQQKPDGAGREEEKEELALSDSASRFHEASLSTPPSARARVFTSAEWLMFDSVCTSQLPPAARPVFIRFTAEIGKTETFKLKKGPLKKQGFQLPSSLISQGDCVYVVSKKRASNSSLASLDCAWYSQVDEALLDELRAGAVQL